jgi:hypothetical protein
MSMSRGECPQRVERIQAMLRKADTETLPSHMRIDRKIANPLFFCRIIARGYGILGTIHTLIYNPDASFRIPTQHRLSLGGSLGDQERPVVYSLALASSRGLPSWLQEYLKMIYVLESYTEEFPPGDDRWKAADIMTAKIDGASPGGSRTWTKEGRKPKHKTSRHRGYLKNGTASKNSIRNFIQVKRSRLAKIDVSKAQEPLPRSVVYVGWSRKEGQRLMQHEGHEQLSSIPWYVP